MRSVMIKIIRIALIVGGIAALSYPYVSEKVNSLHTSRAIQAYDEVTESMSEEDYSYLWEQAEAYNRKLAEPEDQYSRTEALHENYLSCLNVSGSGSMGYIEIPAIGVKLPVYHGTEDSILQTAAGHMEGSSLPVGGASTHSVISGHTGMNRATLFTRLTELKEGDVFYIRVLGKTLSYQVYGTETVLPDDLGSIRIQEGKDLCTLLTCTPYGVNSHRLLVHGERTEDLAIQEEKTENRIQAVINGERALGKQDQMFLVSIGIIILAIMVRVLWDWKGRRQSNDKTKTQVS